jgi:pyruvate kinase
LKKTKIICTIGPASLSKSTLRKMYRAGMNGARMNTAYGTLEQYGDMIDTVREVADIPVIVDIKGPEIRLKVKGKRTVKEGDVLETGFKDESISFSRNFYSGVDVGDNIFVDNGKLSLKVAEKR